MPLPPTESFKHRLALTPFSWMVITLAVASLLSVALWDRDKLTSAQAGDSTNTPAAASAPATSASTNPATAPAPPPPTPSVSAQVGVDAVLRRLGNKTPVGRHIIVMHVEGNAGDYLPNVRDPLFTGVKLIPRSGPGRTNGHTQWTSSAIYGPRGLAPGIPQVEYFTTNYWLTIGALHTGAPQLPDAGDARLSTHSWISQGGNPAEEAEILRRVDDLIDRTDFLVVAGVNNGADTTVPPLLGSAYNVIAVGSHEGRSSGGYTRIEGVGRCKPDIVAPGGLTSYSTPVTAAVVARLLEQADRMAASGLPDAKRSEVIRAVLLAGAEKPPGWKPAPGKPLDEHFGAGVVRFDHSFDILTDGPVTPPLVAAPPAPGTTPAPGSPAAPGAPVSTMADPVVPVPPRSWSLVAVLPHGSLTYTFKIAHDAGEISILAAWNRRIDSRVIQDIFTHQPRWLGTPRLAHFDLTFLRDLPDGATEIVGQSTSAVDNLQHVYLPQLPAGRYRIQITRRDSLDEPYDLALAWRVEPAGK